MNATQDPTVYADPCPGKRGDDVIQEACSKCGGDGLYHGPTNLMISNPHGGGNFPGCLRCMGHGHTNVKVSSVRARRAANAAKADRDAAPLREWLAAKNAWEQNRRAALVSGFVGHLGAKITDLAGTVTAAIEYDTTTYQGRALPAATPPKVKPQPKPRTVPTQQREDCRN